MQNGHSEGVPGCETERLPGVSLQSKLYITVRNLHFWVNETQLEDYSPQHPWARFTGLTQLTGESVEHAWKEEEIGSMETKLRDQKAVEESGDEVQSRAEAEQEQVRGLSGGILEIRLTGFED